jgi:cell division protein FtsI (penicillin-binding protein 3)
LQRRLVVASAVFALWAAGIETRLIVLQVFQHDELVARADKQQMRTVAAPAKRGEIFDRRGRMLAYSVDADTIWAVPSEIKDTDKTVAALCAALDDCDRKFRVQLGERLGRQQRGFEYVKRRVAPLEAKRVAALGLDGVRFMKESKRFYPNRELAANVLGYVGVDNVGLDGIEAAFDKVVRGRPGTLLIQTDARSNGFSRLERSPTIGSAIELTLDEQLQYIVERELKAGVAENSAEGGAAVIMDPHNGEILAMATWPTFNPNSYNESAADARRNRAVQDLYEPGSTFKIVTASAAFEEHVVRPDDMIDASGGSIKFPGRKPINDTHDYGVLSFTDVIVKSSNVGAIRVGLRLGPERLGLYINRFGFGRPTSIDFPAENPGIVWNPAKLNDSALASVSMGYQVGVTPIQMAAAVSSVANGGTLYEPRILRTVLGDGTRTPVKPKAVRQAIKPETAATMTTIMEQVVQRGTAKAAQLPGFTVAGKTGTAAKLINGRYSVTNYNASFVGFVPSRAPVVTIIVVIDSPHAKGHTGGAAAAPVFQRIADASLRYLGVAPTIGAPPPVMVTHREPSAVTATASPVNSAPVVTLAGSGEPPLVPDLRGQGAREAMRALARLGLTARLSGAGVVIDQQPQPGSPLDPGATCTLVLSRQSQSPRPAGAQP